MIADGRGPVLCLVRGDDRLNEIKLQNALGTAVRAAREDEVESEFGAPPGFIGPVGARAPVLADEALRGLSGLVAGANAPDQHLRGVEPGRDFGPEWADIRRVVEGDRCPAGAEIRIEPAIEVANIFKLGTRYSEPLGATYLDEDGTERLIWMGSYGIGPARVMAAAVEQFADDNGISWPRAIAPFDVELVALGKDGEPARDAAERLYADLREQGLDVLFDDRDDASPGEKFAEAELLGCPLRVTVGKRGLETGEVEVQARRGLEKSAAPLDGAAAELLERWRALP